MQLSKPEQRAEKFPAARKTICVARPTAAALALAVALPLLSLNRAHGENQVDYRFENYQEDDNRIHVTTHSALFDVTLNPHITVKGEAVLDAISGATPTGAPPPSDATYTPDSTPPPAAQRSHNVPLAEMHDERRAGNVEFDLNFGRHHFSPQVSYSEESDYVSRGASLGYSLDLNEKNTTLNFGWSHNWDRMKGGVLRSTYKHKNADDFLIGLNQLLSPTTVLTVNFTYGHAQGYMADPYRSVYFNGYPQDYDPANPDAVILYNHGESRPSKKDKYIAYVALSQFFTPVNGSAEVSYRFYHDTFGVDAQTVTLAWFQKIGRRIVVSPSFRYYYQTAASFYATQFAGDPTLPAGDILPDGSVNPALPDYYSSDYRLSEFQSFSYGINVSYKANKWLSFDASYKRYIMEGLDGVTSQTAYPAANVVTIGARFWF